ncbi:MAG: aspartyl protease family protein [Candidatus Aminicenantes bacterium RBG_16_66_30]
MNKRIGIMVLLLPVLLSLGRTPERGRDQAAAPRKGVNGLEALILADSFRDAERLAAEVLADPAADLRTRAVCGLAFLKAGRIREAETILEEIVSLSPDDPEARLGLGRIARIRNDPEAAMEHLRRAVPSRAFYEEALHLLWRTAWDRGPVSGLLEVYKMAEERYGRESKPLPSWFTNGLAQVQGLAGRRLFEMEGRFEHLTVPLVTNADPRIRIRMISLKLNGKGDYLFDIDSASADFLTVSPLLAEEMGLALNGNSTASGVGTATAAVRFSVLDKVELGGIAFRNVPVMVSDLHTFRGLKKGLIGTGLLKRFNVTIDVEAKAMDLYPLERPELLAAAIDRAAVVADVPLYLFDATTVEASLGGAPAALYILDSAAATNLVDGVFFREYLKPKIDPARIVPSGIQGAGGAQQVNRIDGLAIALGPLVFESQTAHEFPMEELNAIGGRYLAGLLGNPLLWPYRVHMDFRAGRLILEKRPAS